MKKNTARRDDGKAASTGEEGRTAAQGYLQIMRELKRLMQIAKSNARLGHGSAGRNSLALHDRRGNELKRRTGVRRCPRRRRGPVESTAEGSQTNAGLKMMACW